MIFQQTRAPTKVWPKQEKSSIFVSSSESFFFAQTTNSLVKKEKNNDRLRSHDCTRTRPGHPHESRNDERDEEEIGYLARMGERFKGIII